VREITIPKRPESAPRRIRVGRYEDERPAIKVSKGSPH
jgi:hypothetical protein